MNSGMYGPIKYSKAGYIQPQISEVAEIRVDLIYFSAKMSDVKYVIRVMQAFVAGK